MSGLHLNQIAKHVKEKFERHVPQDDLGPKDPERDAKIVTRCLAAYAVQHLADCADADAGASVVDRGDDNGLDAIFFSQSQNVLYVVQSKWIKDGRSEPSLADVMKFCKGVSDLVNSEYDRFNARIQRQRTVIESAIANFGCKMHLVVVHTGTPELAEPATNQVKDLLVSLNDAAELAIFTLLNQERIYTAISESAGGGAISLECVLQSWGKIDEPHLAFYGMVTGTAVREWWKKYGERLLARNLRAMLGPTEVNRQINSTIDTNPDDFWYFNNGITVTAKNVEKTIAATREQGTFKATGAFVVNGAQTVSTIGRSKALADKLDRVRIPIRLISLAGAADEYGTRITRTNNTQNRIESRDFASLDPEQQRIRVELQLEGVQYQVSRTDQYRPSPTTFDLEEAAVALACAEKDSDLAVVAKREVSRLWNDLESAPYKRLFNPSRNSLYIYHVVLVQRIIDECLQTMIDALPKRSGKRYGALVHGNRIAAAAIFARTKFEPALGANGVDQKKWRTSLDGVASTVIDRMSEKLENDYADNFPAVVFKNAVKSRALFKACSVEPKKLQTLFDGVNAKQSG